MVFARASQYPSEREAIDAVAETTGCPVELLEEWVRQAKHEAATRSTATPEQRAELQKLLLENIELKLGV